jgi:hypothetical protein
MLRLLPVAPILGVLAIALAAHTALTRGVVTPRGEGSSRISGVAVSDVRYVLAEADPGLATGVTFTVRPARDGLAVRVSHGDGAWSTCAVRGGRATCQLRPAVAVVGLERLRVVAA